MRCNPRYWLLGLVPIAMLSWVAVQLEQTGIELDLSRRASDALHRAGMSWAGFRFVGRDAVLTGRAPEEREPTYGAFASSRIARNSWSRSQTIAGPRNGPARGAYRWPAMCLLRTPAARC
jgi:hypothetical protein